MSATDQHMAAAQELATRIAGGVLNNDDAAYVERYGSRWISEALAAAEREGMKREGWRADAEYKPGQRVEKYTGEALWSGTVRAAYLTSKGGLRYVVEVEPQGFQMIAVPSQLRASEAERTA